MAAPRPTRECACGEPAMIVIDHNDDGRFIEVVCLDCAADLAPKDYGDNVPTDGEEGEVTP